MSSDPVMSGKHYCASVFPSRWLLMVQRGMRSRKVWSFMHQLDKTRKSWTQNTKLFFRNTSENLVHLVTFSPAYTASVYLGYPVLTYPVYPGYPVLMQFCLPGYPVLTQLLFTRVPRAHVASVYLGYPVLMRLFTRGTTCSRRLCLPGVPHALTPFCLL